MKRFRFFLMIALLAGFFMPATSSATCGCSAGKVSPLFCLPTQATKAALGLLEATGVISSKESYTSELATIGTGLGMTLFGGITSNHALAYKGLAWAGNGAVTLMARSYEPLIEGYVFDLTYLLMAGTAYALGGSFGKVKNYLYAFALPSLAKVTGRTVGYIWDVFIQESPPVPIQGGRKGECHGDEEAFAAT